MKRLYILHIQHGAGSVELTFDMDADAYRAMTEIDNAREAAQDAGAPRAFLTLQALGRVAKIDCLQVGAMTLTAVEPPPGVDIPETLALQPAELGPNVARFTPLSGGRE